MIPLDKEHALLAKLNKYNDLVWYARSHPKQDTEYWRKHPSDIREGAFKAQERVEAAYPFEVNALEDNWNHGFNSGCLAAFRYALTLLDEDTWTDEETGEEFPCGGYVVAEDDFPSLDT